MGPVGKNELLEWCSRHSGRQCTRFDDIKDGAVLLKLFHSIWPGFVDIKKLRKMQPKHEWEIKANWDSMKSVMVELNLPLHILDRPGVTAGRFKSCYSLLVMLYFLQHLSSNHDFSVDFTHPIDLKLASFLQSTASVECLVRGGAIQLSDLPSSVASLMQVSRVNAPSHAPNADAHSQRSADSRELVSLANAAPQEHEATPVHGRPPSVPATRHAAVTSPSAERQGHPSDQSATTAAPALQRQSNQASQACQTDLSAHRLQQLLISNLKASAVSLISERPGAAELTALADPFMPTDGADVVAEHGRWTIEQLSRERDLILQRQQNEIDSIQTEHQLQLELLQQAANKQAEHSDAQHSMRLVKERSERVSELGEMRKQLAYEAELIRQDTTKRLDGSATLAEQVYIVMPYIVMASTTGRTARRAAKAEAAQAHSRARERDCAHDDHVTE